MDTNSYNGYDTQPTNVMGSEPTTAQPTAAQPTTAQPTAQASGASWQQTQEQPPIPGQNRPAPGASGSASQGAGPDDGKKRHGSGILKPVLCGLLGGVVGAGALTAVLLGTGVVGTSRQPLNSGTSQQITIEPGDDDATLATAVAAKAVPSVVSVYVSTSNAEGSGSGVILDTDGNIITNYHVIDGAESISVTIDGKSYTASYVGGDESSDIAVIKADLEGDAVTPIEVGDSSDLQVGDWVMTIGSPFGYEQSVSQGIVSALTRNTMLQNSDGNTIYTNLIQVDAAINPGNSGGALVNSKGQLVGISSLYSSSTESSASVGFAIPGNYAVEIAQKVINGEQVLHAYIGLSMQSVNAQNALTKNLSVSQGAYVASVAEGGPAEAAGIQQGDVITGIDGTEITSADGVILAVRSHDIGDTVKVTVMRGSEQKEFDVTLGSDEALQNSTDTTVNDNGTINGNGGTGNGYGDGYGYGDSDGFMELFQQWLEQQNGGSGRGYGY